MCFYYRNSIGSGFEIMKTLVLFLVGLLIGGLTAKSMAQDTTINYKGQPPPSAIAPSMSAFSQDVCVVPVSGAYSSTVFGISAGTTMTDKNCERIKLAKTLNDLGLKVAAVGVLCEDDRVWRAMIHSDSPCPVLGSIGSSALEMWATLREDDVKKMFGGKLPNFTKPESKPTEDK